MKRIIYLLLLLLSTATVQADEYSPAYLELKQTDDDTFDMLWKVPALGSDQRLSLYVGLDEDIEVIGLPRSSFVGNAFIETSVIRRPGGLSGAEIYIEGLTSSATEALVRIERLDGSTEVARLVPSSPSFVVTAAAGFWEVAKTYLVFGMQHIWQGMDHLLFIACLILIARTWRRILITITGFTLAHSVTLTLAALGVVNLSIPPIEAVIALSIVFLAREIALDRRDSLTWRYPIAVSASFGLLHGFGFASALSEIGLPQTEIPAALLSFNLGVEIGQVVFVCVIIALVHVMNMGVKVFGGLKDIKLDPINWLQRVEKPIAYVVGGITTLWTVERVAVFWVY